MKRVAKAVVVNNNTPLSPLMATNPLNAAVTIVSTAAQMYQNQKTSLFFVDFFQFHLHLYLLLIVLIDFYNP